MSASSQDTAAMKEVSACLANALNADASLSNDMFTPALAVGPFRTDGDREILGKSQLAGKQLPHGRHRGALGILWLSGAFTSLHVQAEFKSMCSNAFDLCLRG